MIYCPYEIVTDYRAFGLQLRHVTTAFGRMAVRVGKRRESEVATVYVHGAGADWSTWSPLLQAEADLSSDTHDQILLDLPGFGASENSRRELPIAEVGWTVIAATQQLGYSKVRLVGHSLGGFLVLDMASRFRQSVQSIHLAAGSYFSILYSIQRPILSFAHSPTVAATFGTQFAIARTGRLGQAAVSAVGRAGLLPFLLYPFARHPFKLKRSVIHSLYEQLNPSGMLKAARNGYGYDADKQWSKIECDVLSTYGSHDRLVSRGDMNRLGALLPGSSLKVVDDASHLLHIEQPHDVLAGLKLW